MEKNSKGKILVFSSASGAGKTTILNHLREKIPQLVYSISVTTRQPRDHEIDGIHYYFTGVEEFRKKIRNNEFAEWAEVHGNYYGTPKKFIDSTIKSGSNIVMDIDVFGKKKLDISYPEAVGIFITPPSIKELEKRLYGRKTDSGDTIKLRLLNSAKEIAFAKDYGKYEYFIENDCLEKALAETVSLVEKIITGKKIL
jgi:guanylate kinase